MLVAQKTPLQRQGFSVGLLGSGEITAGGQRSAEVVEGRGHLIELALRKQRHAEPIERTGIAGVRSQSRLKG